MGSGCCRVAPPIGSTVWFEPDSTESFEWQDAHTGYGQGRAKDYFTGATGKMRFNREGNRKGELAGSFIFYQHASESTNYALHARRPVIELGKNMCIYSKAFVKCPLGRMPIGTNNIPPGRMDIQGQGEILLAASPRAIALFVDIDGKAQTQEHFCQESAKNMGAYYQKRKCQTKPEILHKAIEGSFVTFIVTRKLDAYAFVHLPVIASVSDCEMDTGPYAYTVVKAFAHLFTSLPHGKHKIDIKMHMYYDHCDYNYFPLAMNINARGMWYQGLDNEDLTTSHPDPQNYCRTNNPVAIGTFYVNIPENYAPMLDGILDRKPPKWKIKEGDMAAMIAEAKNVAFERFCSYLSSSVSGHPDTVSLTTGIMESRHCQQETGHRYRYEYVEFVAMWRNMKDTSPDAEGIMFEGCMARGEIAPRVTSRSWTWLPKHRSGEEVVPKPFKVKNKYISAFITLLKIHLDKESKARERKT